MQARVIEASERRRTHRAWRRWARWLGVSLLGACAACTSEEPVEPARATVTPYPCPESHTWPSCDQIESPQRLVELAERFDQVAREEHLAGDGLLRNLRRTADLSGVEHWKHHPNVILWSGMYLAAQALRWAVTRDDEALDNARVVVAGLRELTEVTGVAGLYGRSLDKPGVSYDYDGAEHPAWAPSTAPGYEGWSFDDDVSKDGYDGLMFGYSAALEHFEDPVLLGEVRDLVGQVASHLVENGLQIIDHTGEVTEHGKMYHSAFDDFPGFNAMLVSSWLKVAAQAGGDQGLDDFYYGCLMGLRPQVSCPAIDQIDLGTYMETMETMMGLYRSECQQNYDNFDMCYQAVYPLMRRESDAELHQRLDQVLRTQMFHTEDPMFQSIATIGNSLFTFIYASLTCDGPDDDPILRQAVDDAICKLKSFPPVKLDRYIPAGTQEEVCRNRQDDPCAAETIPLTEYHFDHYLWRLDFFEIQEERPEDPQHIYSPEDFLVAYWLGRYHGLIDPEL